MSFVGKFQRVLNLLERETVGFKKPITCSQRYDVCIMNDIMHGENLKSFESFPQTSEKRF